jgi:agmatine/peptidylarginine deiminase
MFILGKAIRSLSTLVPVLTISVASIAEAGNVSPPPWDEAAHGPLPHWRAGPRPALDPKRSLVPTPVAGAGLQVPTSGVIASPPEYAPCAGVLFRYSSGAWPEVVTACVAALTRSSLHDEIAYVIVSGASQQSQAASQFAAAGANLGKVQFITVPTDSVWLRDYGPHYIWQSGTPAIVDSHYYPTRPLDNFVPTRLADDEFLIPSYDIGLYYSGGNFQPGADGDGFMTSLVHLDNPGFGLPFIGELMSAYQGIDTLHVMPQLPWSVDGTGHIDMWMYIVDDDTVIISEFLPGSNATAIQITDNAAIYMANLGYEVFRVPDLNAYHPYDPACHYTYTNAFRVNDRIFVPQYADAGPAFAIRDAEAIATFQAAAPEAQIVPIDCYDIIWAAGAIHCIVMQVPRYAQPLPAAHVVSPDGGELLVTGNTHDLSWCAVDDGQVSAVDLHYSTDGGASFPHLIAAGEVNDGHFDWVVPGTLTDEALVRVVAHDDEANNTEAVSESAFEIADAEQRVYDFGEGAGIDRWGWGYQTLSWAYNDGVRYPVASELSASAYALLDASDNSRYGGVTPSSGRESTHVFEFQIDEAPARIIDVEIAWEGYAQDCTQTELYVWDRVAGNWGDGTGLSGENRFMDNFAGNRDEVLGGHLRADFDRYIDGDGLLTILLYAERSSDRAYHDYLSVTVSYEALAVGDVNEDGVVDFADILAIVGAWGPCSAPCPPDVNGDGDVGFGDILLVIANWS